MVVQVLEQTRDEKIAMYLKLTKREIAEMLINVNEAVDRLTKSLRAPETVTWKMGQRCAACQGDGGHNRGDRWVSCDACGGKGY